MSTHHPQPSATNSPVSPRQAKVIAHPALLARVSRGSSSAPGSPATLALPATDLRLSWATADFVRTPPAAASWIFIYVLIALIAALIGYAAWAKVPVHIETRGVLTSEY